MGYGLVDQASDLESLGDFGHCPEGRPGIEVGAVRITGLEEDVVSVEQGVGAAWAVYGHRKRMRRRHHHGCLTTVQMYARGELRPSGSLVVAQPPATPWCVE